MYVIVYLCKNGFTLLEYHEIFGTKVINMFLSIFGRDGQFYLLYRMIDAFYPIVLIRISGWQNDNELIHSR